MSAIGACESWVGRVAAYIGGSHFLKEDEDGDEMGEIRYSRKSAAAYESSCVGMRTQDSEKIHVGRKGAAPGCGQRVRSIEGGWRKSSRGT